MYLVLLNFPERQIKLKTTSFVVAVGNENGRITEILKFGKFKASETVLQQMCYYHQMYFKSESLYV